MKSGYFLANGWAPRKGSLSFAQDWLCSAYAIALTSPLSFKAAFLLKRVVGKRTH